MVCVVLQYVFVGKIKLKYRWILAVQTHVVQGSTVHSHSCITVTIIHFQNFFLSCRTEIFCLLNSNSLFTSPPSPWWLPFYFLSLWIDYFKHLTWMELYSICPFLIGFFTSIMSSRFIRVVACGISFPLRLNNIPLCVVCVWLCVFTHRYIYIYAKFVLHIPLSTDTCTAFSFWLLSVMLLWTWMYRCVPAFSSLGYMFRIGIAGLYVNSMFNFLRNCQTISIAAVPFYSPISIRVPVLHPGKPLFSRGFGGVGWGW